MWKHECSFDSCNFLQFPSQHANYRRNSFLPPIKIETGTSAVNKIVNSDHSNLHRPFCSMWPMSCVTRPSRNWFSLQLEVFCEKLAHEMTLGLSSLVSLRCWWKWDFSYPRVFYVATDVDPVSISSWFLVQMVCGEDWGYDDVVGHYDTVLE